MVMVTTGVALVAGVAAGRASRRSSWLLPTGVTLAIVIVTMSPLAGAGLGGGEPFELIAPVGVWAAGLLVTCLAVRLLTFQGRAWLSGSVGVVGALALVNAVVILRVTQQVPPLHPVDQPWLWYWAAVAPGGFDLGGTDGLGQYVVRDVLELLPILLTAALAFAIAFVHQAATRSRTTTTVTDSRRNCSTVSG